MKTFGIAMFALAALTAAVSAHVACHATTSGSSGTTVMAWSPHGVGRSLDQPSSLTPSVIHKLLE